MTILIAGDCTLTRPCGHVEELKAGTVWRGVTACPVCGKVPRPDSPVTILRGSVQETE